MTKGGKLEPSWFMEAQFKALREEIIETKRRNFQIIGLGVASLPAGAVVANKYDTMFYVALPAVVVVVALLYLGSNNAIIRCGAYIREHIEPREIIGWECWLEEGKGTRDSEKMISRAIRLLFAIYLLVSLALAREELRKWFSASLPQVPRATEFAIGAYLLASLWFMYPLISSFRTHTSVTQKPASTRTLPSAGPAE